MKTQKLCKIFSADYKKPVTELDETQYITVVIMEA